MLEHPLIRPLLVIGLILSPFILMLAAVTAQWIYHAIRSVRAIKATNQSLYERFKDALRLVEDGHRPWRVRKVLVDSSLPAQVVSYLRECAVVGRTPRYMMELPHPDYPTPWYLYDFVVNTDEGRVRVLTALPPTLASSGV